MGFRVEGLGLRVWRLRLSCWGWGYGLKVWYSSCRVWAFQVQGLDLGLGSRVEDSILRAWVAPDQRPPRASTRSKGLGFTCHFLCLWEGCRESRRCSRVTYPESCITKYTSTRRLMFWGLGCRDAMHRPSAPRERPCTLRGFEFQASSVCSQGSVLRCPLRTLWGTSTPDIRGNVTISRKTPKKIGPILCSKYFPEVICLAPGQRPPQAGARTLG